MSEAEDIMKVWKARAERERMRHWSTEQTPGARMRVRRIELGVTLRDLAREMGIRHVRLSYIETGKQDAPSSFWRACERRLDLPDGALNGGKV